MLQAVNDSIGRVTLEVALLTAKEKRIREALLRNHGHQGHAAEELGIHRNTLISAMKEFGIGGEEYKLATRYRKQKHS